MVCGSRLSPVSFTDEDIQLTNYPNPFNPTTQINFNLKEAADVQLTIYNVNGQKLRTLFSGHRSAGNYQAIWDGQDNAGQVLPSGTYICRLEKIGAGTKSYGQTRKMILIK